MVASATLLTNFALHYVEHVLLKMGAPSTMTSKDL
jgi:hypothetical protein